MKSTKVMNVFGGCIVQVTTQNKDSIAESLVFVPHNTFKNGKIIGC
jgi:formylmethanofuran dehydrogenase subunit D